MKEILTILVLIISLLSCRNQSVDNLNKQNDTKINQEILKQYIESIEDDRNTELTIPNDKFVFIEIIEGQTSKVISYKNKKSFMIPIKNIDFPEYSYNDSSQVLTTWDRTFKPNKEELKLVFGNGIWLGNDRGSGASTRLNDIYYLPYYYGETAIYKIDSIGTVYLRHENMYYKVNSAETIMDSTFYDLNIEGENGGKIKVKREFRISNHGFLDKKAILFDTYKCNKKLSRYL